jgi:hypothetical protein
MLLVQRNQQEMLLLQNVFRKSRMSHFDNSPYCLFFLRNFCNVWLITFTQDKKINSCFYIFRIVLHCTLNYFKLLHCIVEIYWKRQYYHQTQRPLPHIHSPCWVVATYRNLDFFSKFLFRTFLGFLFEQFLLFRTIFLFECRKNILLTFNFLRKNRSHSRTTNILFRPFLIFFYLFIFCVFFSRNNITIVITTKRE